MRILSFCVALFALIACKSGGSDDLGVLKQRMQDFMAANQKQDFKKVLDYTYPKLFELVPKATLEESMKEAFATPDFVMKTDSLHIDSLYPVFKSGKGQYAKVDYSMVMRVILKAADSTGQLKDTYIMAFTGKFGAENIRRDDAGNAIHIIVHSKMIAAKDDISKNWTFVNLREGEQMMEKLFSKEIMDKIATYK